MMDEMKWTPNVGDRVRVLKDIGDAPGDDSPGAEAEMNPTEVFVCIDAKGIVWRVGAASPIAEAMMETAIHSIFERPYVALPYRVVRYVLALEAEKAVDDKGLPPLPESTIDFAEAPPRGYYSVGEVVQIQRDCFAAGMAAGREWKPIDSAPTDQNFALIVRSSLAQHDGFEIGDMLGWQPLPEIPK